VVFSRLQVAGFTLNPDGLVLGFKKVSCLGHVLSFAGIRVNPKRVKIIQNFFPATEFKTGLTVRGNDRLLLSIQPNFSYILEALSSLKRKRATSVPGGKQVQAFYAVKAALS
jgi:hypothetical protein